MSKKNLGQCSIKDNYHSDKDDDIHAIVENSFLLKEISKKANQLIKISYYNIY